MTKNNQGNFNNQLYNCLIMHCLGDTLGYKNKYWEFYGGNDYEAILNKISEFISLGGINKIDLKNWYASDDTLMHLSIITALKSKWKDLNELLNITKNNFIELLKVFKEGIQPDRAPGLTTIKYLNLLKDKDWKDFEFDFRAGGNGCAMRTLCIGIYFYNDIDKLIEYSINSSKMTHPNPIGWLGGLMSAYFCYCIMNKYKIEDWIFEFLDVLENKDIINKYCKTFEEKNAYNEAIKLIYTYINSKFDKNHNLIEDKSNNILNARILKYNNMFIGGHYHGQSGISCDLIAYDALIDAKDNFERLIFYSIMNNFDADTIGCVAFGLYGLLYGLKDVPENMFENLEFKKEIKELSFKK